MSRIKRLTKRDKKSFAPTAEALAATAEERRLLGAPLSTTTDLFVEDRVGQELIRNRMGEARTLTIDKILRPAGRPVAAQRLRPQRTRASAESIKAHKARVQSKTAPEVYDMWGAEVTGGGAKSTRIQVAADSLYSYRPDMPSHVGRLCEIEMAMESVSAVNAVSNTDTTNIMSEGMTMEERADRELLEPLADSDSEPSEPIEQQADVEVDTKQSGNDNRKSRTTRNRDTSERIARESRLRAAQQTRLLRQVDRAASIAKLHRREQRAALLVAQQQPVVAAKTGKPDVIPLLPGEVPQTMRLLPASHSNPLREQFRRVCRTGIVRPVRR